MGCQFGLLVVCVDVEPPLVLGVVSYVILDEHRVDVCRMQHAVYLCMHRLET